MTPYGFRAMARTILDEVLGFRPDFIEHQLAQRTIWLRLLPMRATCRVRSRSTSACATVQVRTRPTDRRTRSDSVNPAERALACHSARSASLAEHQRPESRQGIV